MICAGGGAASADACRSTPSSPFGVDLVEPGGESLGQSPGVGKDDGRAVGGDLIDDAFLDVRPDRRTVHLTRRGPGQIAGGRAERGQVGNRYHHVDVEHLGARRLDGDDRAAAGQEPGHLVEWADRRGQPDPLRRIVHQQVEAVQGDREVRATLGAGHRVHLVDDHRPDPGEHLPGPAGEQQEQRLRRGDQDVGAVPGEHPPVGRRRVPGAQGHRDVRHRLPARRGQRADAGERRPQVAFDVDGQRLERRDVQHPAAVPGIGRRRSGDQSVDGGQERRQGLTGPGRRDHQGVPTLSDRLPGAGLGRGGASKTAANQSLTGGENAASGSGPVGSAGGWAVTAPLSAPGPTGRPPGPSAPRRSAGSARMNSTVCEASDWRRRLRPRFAR